MTYENLLIEERSDILLVTLNRPKALNALNRKTIEELEYLFKVDAVARENLSGVILTGSGEKSFVAGADIKEFLGLEADQGRELAQKGQDVFFSIERFHRPVVAAVNGFALGGGCELAMACHLRVASENARFGQPEVNLGLVPGYGGTQRLIQYLGKTKATELLMTADMIDAAEAYRLGLVNYVVAPGEEVARAEELLRKIGRKGPVAISKIIAAVNAYFDNSRDGFADEVHLFGQTTETEDFVEGATAFTEKRKPSFKGR